jgi:hypothetical protein
MIFTPSSGVPNWAIISVFVSVLSHAKVTLSLLAYHVMRSFKLSFEGTS